VVSFKAFNMSIQESYDVKREDMIQVAKHFDLALNEPRKSFLRRFYGDNHPEQELTPEKIQWGDAEVKRDDTDMHQRDKTMRQRDNFVNAEAPARRCRCTRATTPRRQRDDAKEPARKCRGVSVKMSTRGVSGSTSAVSMCAGTQGVQGGLSQGRPQSIRFSQGTRVLGLTPRGASICQKKYFRPIGRENGGKKNPRKTSTCYPRYDRREV
jgi:hypothetical protein